MEISENNIYLGDAYKLIKSVADKSVDLIITDPPYEITGIHGSGVIKKSRETNPNFYTNQICNTKLDKGIKDEIMREWVRVMKKINIYIWCNKEQIFNYLKYFVGELGCNYEIIIWTKSNVPPFCGTHYLVDKEYCLYFWEQGAPVYIKYDKGKTFFIGKTNIDDKDDFKHPTIKPLEITKVFIENSSKMNDVVLDTFLGSGTTCVGAKQLNRRYIGFEVNDEYYKIAKDRLNGINQRGEMSIFETDFEKLEQMDLFEKGGNE